MFHRGAGMKGSVTRATAVAALAILAAGCGEKEGAATTVKMEVKTADAPSPLPAATATATATATTTPTATPSASASADGDEALPADAKKFDCGAKGQKPCPMQKWMKTVMAGASSSGDGARLAEALTYVEKHPPPGFTSWASIAADGAKKARADDIDGAKASCKQCHDQFKSKYKATLRDRPF
jgi:hypothetical protein